MEGKNCRTCGEYYSFAYFPKGAYTDGHANTCKFCNKIRRQELEAAHKNKTSHLLEYNGKKEVEGAEILLRNLGYELYNPENPVCDQFYRHIWLKYGIDLRNKKGSITDPF